MTNPRQVVVITSKNDVHVEPVATVLEGAGQAWVRINTEDTPRNVGMTIDPTSGEGSLSVRDSDIQFQISNVGAVWYRKPEPPDLKHFEVEAAALEYIEAEFTEVLHGLYALWNDALWINNPLTTRLAHRKLLQLRRARELGFDVPRTLITNSPQDALAFAESIHWDLAVKSLGSITINAAVDGGQLVYGLFTRRIDRHELISLSSKIPHLPSVFQEYIDKDYELRVVLVGDLLFFCRIDSQGSELTKEDMRFDIRSAHHQLVSCPDLAPKIRAYAASFGINFGCFDIAKSKDGRYVFFECNPNGQWLWIEELTGAPISRAIGNMLISACQTAKA